MKNNEKILYLCGSMEYSKDPSSWRNKMEKELRGQYEVISPPIKFCPVDKGDTFEFKTWIRDNYIMPDIHDVMRCSHLFIKIDKATGRGSGSWGELTIATYLNKHIIYMIDDIDVVNIPSWSLGCLTHAYRVDNIDHAIKYLKKEV